MKDKLEKKRSYIDVDTLHKKFLKAPYKKKCEILYEALGIVQSYK